MSIIAWIVLGAIAGYLAGFLVRGDEGLGVIGHIVLGIVGALVLNAILRLANVIPPGGWIWQFIIAVIGAVLLIWVWRLIRGNRPAV